jgi:hypothetical protein
MLNKLKAWFRKPKRVYYRPLSLADSAIKTKRPLER